jgi:hypothetical protein
MEKIKIKRKVIEFMAMEELFRRLKYKGGVSFMITVAKNYNALGRELTEYRFEQLTSSEYKECQKQLRIIKSNILGDSPVFDDKKKERFEKAAEEFWKTGKNPQIKEEIEKIKEEWTRHIKNTDIEVELIPYDITEIPKDFLDDTKNRDIAATFVKLCEEIVT